MMSKLIHILIISISSLCMILLVVFGMKRRSEIESEKQNRDEILRKAREAKAQKKENDIVDNSEEVKEKENGEK